MAWHLRSGPDCDDWFSYSSRRRQLILEEVRSRIEKHNELMEDR